MPNYAPFIKVWAVVDGTNVDISDAVSNLTYKKSIEKENEISFSVERSYIERLSDSILRRGLTILFQFGFKGGKQSPLQKARVVELKRRYAANVSFMVKARDLGNAMKKSYSDKVWSGLTTSQICQQIAPRYGLEFFGEDTDFVWESYPQGQKDDYSFLQELVAKEQDGNYNIYVDSGKLILEKRGMDRASFLTFEYGKGNRVISFEAIEEEKSNSVAPLAGSNLVGFDPNNKESLEATANKDTEVTNVDLGQYGNTYSADGELLSAQINVAERFVLDRLFGSSDQAREETSFGSKEITPLQGKEEVVNKANTNYKSAKLKVKKGKLKIMGEPELKLNSVVTIRGVLAQDEGNYLIDGITHTIAPSGGFTTVVNMLKNGRSVATSAAEVAATDPTKVNATVGPESVEAVTEVFRFDAEGNRLTDPKTPYQSS